MQPGLALGFMLYIGFGCLGVINYIHTYITLNPKPYLSHQLAYKISLNRVQAGCI